MAARDEAANLIMNIMASAGVQIGTTQKAIEEKGVSGAVSEAKSKVMASAIIQGPKKTIGFLSKMTKSIAGKFGIQFSMASILKQSQIFTGALGTIFQILGAFVDVMLAPFMPLFVRLIKRMVSWIPLIQEKAEEAAKWLENAWFTNEGDVGAFLRDTIVAAVKLIPWGLILKKIFGMSPKNTLTAGLLLAPATGGLSIPFSAGVAFTHQDTQIPSAGRLARGAGGGAAGSVQGYFDASEPASDESVWNIAKDIVGRFIP
jgi:hypothetical protein